MSRPKLFRDPVHGQLRFDRPAGGGGTPDSRLGGLLLALIDSREFQRLRHIKQLGLACFVFHGAEHSRFSHSMGVVHLAREMHDRILRNMDVTGDEQRRLATCAAALLHDVGHGPFSHTLEGALSSLGIRFVHEKMTERILLEADSQAHRILAAVDPSFPAFVAEYIRLDDNKAPHWSHKIVSSQLDADRLDYLLRDAHFTGMQGPGFDLERILDMLGYLDERRLKVDRRAIGAIDAYLLSLDNMFTTVYFHHTLRSGVFMLGSAMKRAFVLHQDGAKGLFPNTLSGGRHPLLELLDKPMECPLDAYLRLTDELIWALLEYWQDADDFVLSDLSRKLLRRRFLKTANVYQAGFQTLDRLREVATRAALAEMPRLSEAEAAYYIGVDEPERTSYKKYNWVHEQGSDESIWIVGGPDDPTPIEQEQRSIVAALKNATYSRRLIFPEQAREAVQKAMASSV